MKKKMKEGKSMDVLAASKYLQYCRSRTTLTLDAVEKKACVSASTISRYLSGNVKSLNDDAFQAIVEAFGGSMEEYDQFRVKENLIPLSKAQEGNAAPDFQRLSSFYDDLFEKLRLHYQAQCEEISSRCQQSIEELRNHHEKCVEEVKAQCEKRVEEIKAQCADRVAAEERYAAHMQKEKNRYFVVMCVVVALYAGQWLLDALMPSAGWLRKALFPDLGRDFMSLFG